VSEEVVSEEVVSETACKSAWCKSRRNLSVPPANIRAVDKHGGFRNSRCVV